MNLFAINLLLAFAWSMLVGTVNLSNLLVGYFVGLGALWISKPLYNTTTSYFLRSWRSLKLAVYFIWELLKSSLQVAWTVLSPWKKPSGAVIEVPLTVQTDIEILMLTSLISLTPGTLSLDVSEDRKTLYVHAMFADDPEGTIRDIKQGMERMVGEVFKE